MTVSVTPTGDSVFTAVGYFLTRVLSGVEVVQGQVNRVPQPANQNHVVMWELRRSRLATNRTVDEDCSFEASIAGAAMTVTEVLQGTIRVGAVVFGQDVPAGAQVVEQTSGSVGGTGVYLLSASGTVGLSTLSAGQVTITGNFSVAVQMDIHGPNCAMNAAIVSALLRDPRGILLFEESGQDVVPLHADEARQLPFMDGEKQFESRYVIEALLQVNEVVTGLSQEYASSLELEVISVEATFPP